jgi:uncharacterized SAM-binding protein YcdF (DUF218 family)
MWNSFLEHCLRLPGPAARSFLGLLGALLWLDSVYLISQTVTHFGVLLPTLFGILCIVYALFCAPWLQWLGQRRWRAQLWALGLAGLAGWLLSLALFFAAIVPLGAPDALPEAESPQWLLVLGAGAPDGEPSPILAERLNRALELAQRYPQARLVVSGGLGYGTLVSEAHAMAKYLRAHGLPAERIVLEDRSRNTYQNILFTQRVLASQGSVPSGSVCIVTSDFHAFRSLKLAQKAGWTQVRMATAPTPLYARYPSRLREYFSIAAAYAMSEI